MKKGAGFFFAIFSAILAIACLAIMYVYSTRGGNAPMQVMIVMGVAILCEFLLMAGDHGWTEFVAIIGAVLLAYVMMTVLSGGVWNIAESINGIRMSGIPELAGLNYAMAGLNLAAVIFAILACFTRKRKAAK